MPTRCSVECPYFRVETEMDAAKHWGRSSGTCPVVPARVRRGAVNAPDAETAGAARGREAAATPGATPAATCGREHRAPALSPPSLPSDSPPSVVDAGDSGLKLVAAELAEHCSERCPVEELLDLAPGRPRPSTPVQRVERTQLLYFAAAVGAAVREGLPVRPTAPHWVHFAMLLVLGHSARPPAVSPTPLHHLQTPRLRHTRPANSRQVEPPSLAWPDFARQDWVS